MDLRSYIIEKRGDKTLKEFSKETGIPVGSIFTYEVPGYLEKASVTVISNVCRYYQINPYSLHEFGYNDPDFIDEVVRRQVSFPDEEMKYTVIQFVDTFKDILKLSDEEPRYVRSDRGITHIEIKRKTKGKIILYFLYSRTLPKGKHHYSPDDYSDYFIMLHDAINIFGSTGEWLYFFLTPDYSLYHSMAPMLFTHRGSSSIHVSTIKNSSGKEFVVYLVYSRYKTKFDFSKHMYPITFLDIFWSINKKLDLNPELDVEEMFE